MLKNFFKTAWRNIIKYRVYSIINFTGLTSGLALALMIVTYVQSELSYDQFHEKSNRLYRIAYKAPNGLELASTPPPIAPLLQDFFPEVETAARVYRRDVSITLPNNEQAYEETDVLFADSAFMQMFSINFVLGNPEDGLAEKFTVLINEEMAKKYFGDKNPIGESLILSGRQSFKVVGVVKNFPENSHLHFNLLIPYDNMFDLESSQTAEVLRKNLAVNFIISHSFTYVLLKPDADPKQVDLKMEAFLEKYAQPRYQVGQVFSLMPAIDIHLKSKLVGEPSPTNSMTNIYIFIGVGILTLLIACINYINLSTARSLTRIKEIGIRKIMGSMKTHLIFQYLTESFLFCLAAMMMAYLVFHLTLPLLNMLTGKHLIFTEVVNFPLVALSLLLLLVITILAGSYPAYFIAQFESINALKGNGNQVGTGDHIFRKALVVFQLVIACILLTGSLFIFKQLDYLESRPLGFQKQNVINIPLFSQNFNGFFQQSDSTFQLRLQEFRNVIEMQSEVQGTTLSSGSPGLGETYRGTIPEGFTQEDNLFVANMAVDYDFLITYQMELIAGRSFNRDFVSDPQNSFVINETAVREFKWDTPEKSLGKTIEREGKKGKVVGVVKDFNFTLLTFPLSALVLEIDSDQFNTLSIKFKSANVVETMKRLEFEWKHIFPEKAFEFTFLDEELNEQYSSFRNFGAIIQIFTFISVIISCLGVYGLVLFTVQRKAKEIGVRKVLGGSVGNILFLIYKDFGILIIIGFSAAAPLSYYFVNNWLSNFVYHINIDVLIYGVGFGLVFLVVFLTISYQAIIAARANPIKSLRLE